MRGVAVASVGDWSEACSDPTCGHLPTLPRLQVWFRDPLYLFDQNPKAGECSVAVRPDPVSAVFV